MGSILTNCVEKTKGNEVRSCSNGQTRTDQTDYTSERDSTGSQDVRRPTRNHNFAWEPGQSSLTCRKVTNTSKKKVPAILTLTSESTNCSVCKLKKGKLTSEGIRLCSICYRRYERNSVHKNSSRRRKLTSEEECATVLSAIEACITSNQSKKSLSKQQSSSSSSRSTRTSIDSEEDVIGTGKEPVAINSLNIGSKICSKCKLRDTTSSEMGVCEVCRHGFEVSNSKSDTKNHDGFISTNLPDTPKCTICNANQVLEEGGECSTCKRDNRAKDSDEKHSDVNECDNSALKKKLHVIVSLNSVSKKCSVCKLKKGNATPSGVILCKRCRPRYERSNSTKDDSKEEFIPVGNSSPEYTTIKKCSVCHQNSETLVAGLCFKCTPSCSTKGTESELSDVTKDKASGSRKRFAVIMTLNSASKKCSVCKLKKGIVNSTGVFLCERCRPRYERGHSTKENSRENE